MSRFRILSAVILQLAVGVAARAADLDEFRIKRQEVFEFSAKPQVAAEGDRVTVRFASKGACDVTVVIEDAGGRIVRHLASGVLGPNAPAPLQANSLEQTLVWDGKDDQGHYVDDKASCTVRVSLGLKPQFERTLLWEPKLRVGRDAPPMVATPDGVYVYDGRVLDYVTLYDHAGDYLRAVYPFPGNKIDEVQGLHRRELPQSGKPHPMREGFHQSTFLNCGTNAGFLEELGIGVDRHNNYHGSVSGSAASTMAVRGGRMALARLSLNRLATDGTSGGLPLAGPAVTFDAPVRGNWQRDNLAVSPRSAAFSPDGKWLYLTGYVRAQGTTATKDIVLISSYDWIPVVARVDFEKGDRAEVFLGGAKLSDAGNAPGQFRIPTAVTVDDEGRIYVCDYGNNRIQVFSPEGKHLKSIETPAPAQLEIHRKTKELYVFSWYVPDDSGGKTRENAPRFRVRGSSSRPKRNDATVESALTVLESFENPVPKLACELPLPPVPGRGLGYPSRVALDSWSEKPVIWVVSEWGYQDFITTRGGTELDRVFSNNIRLLALDDGELKPLRNFADDVKKSVVRQRAPEYFRQRLYVDPRTGNLYVGEGETATGKAFKDVVRIDPDTGRVSIVPLPYDAEDMAFGPNGVAYLRTFYYITRHDPARDWMEIPFDYGEEQSRLHTSSSSDRREAPIASGIRLPVKNAGLHHHGGMGVSPKGNIVVAVNNYGDAKLFDETRRDSYDTYADAKSDEGKPYTPRIFPGRMRYGEVHVYDPHGQLIHEDAVPGLTNLDGVEIDRHDNLYFLSAATRILDGKRYFNDMTSTLIKAPPKRAKMISSSDRASVKLPDELRPDRAPELSGGFAGRSWLDGAEWFFGGAGFAGKNAARSGGGCNCYNTRFALDYLSRTFVPEFDHYSVAVLDSAGNLVLRIGRYGNADDGAPLVKEGASPAARSIGGDEVALFYAPYVATHTDRRLFIADPGNGRILSVKLGYHADERVRLQTVVEPAAR
ncbi:MAG: SMP-30/gluconolactonase/LRE family protein [Planctomycetales bacterium]